MKVFKWRPQVVLLEPHGKVESFMNKLVHAADIRPHSQAEMSIHHLILKNLLKLMSDEIISDIRKKQVTLA